MMKLDKEAENMDDELDDDYNVDSLNDADKELQKRELKRLLSTAQNKERKEHLEQAIKALDSKSPRSPARKSFHQTVGLLGSPTKNSLSAIHPNVQNRLLSDQKVRIFHTMNCFL